METSFRIIHPKYQTIMKQFFLCIFLILGSYMLSAQDNGNNPYPASAYPDRIFRNITENPSTSIAISWRTDEYTRENYIEILPAVSDPALTKNANRHIALTEPFQLNAIKVNYHSAKIQDLLPNTLYMYRVGNGDHWSEWFHITTAGKTGEKFSFIYLGDVQMGMRTLWPRVAREAFIKKPDAKL